jgi:hypothetical protein
MGRVGVVADGAAEGKRPAPGFVPNELAGRGAGAGRGGSAVGDDAVCEGTAVGDADDGAGELVLVGEGGTGVCALVSAGWAVSSTAVAAFGPHTLYAAAASTRMSITTTAAIRVGTRRSGRAEITTSRQNRRREGV